MIASAQKDGYNRTCEFSGRDCYGSVGGISLNGIPQGGFTARDNPTVQNSISYSIIRARSHARIFL